MTRGRAPALAFAAFAAAMASPAAAADWLMQPQESRLGFSGIAAGAAFTGSFSKWSAAIAFDPAHPEAGRAEATIDLASAASGDRQRDGALPQADWFDVRRFPQARFEATHFVAKGGGLYEAPGRLTLRGVARDVVLPFSLTISGDTAHAKGHLDLIRTDFGVGQGAWASSHWVALEVGVDFELVARQVAKQGEQP